MGLFGCLNAQTTRSTYIGLNIPPLLGNAVDLGIEFNLKPAFSVDIYSGYVFNSNLDSPIKVGTPYDLNKKSGFFLKLGARYNFRNEINKFAPLVGLNLVNSLAVEEGTYDADFDDSTPNEPFAKNSYNLGLNGIIGLTTPSDKKLNMDIGIQVGALIVDNLIDFQSYMPGMGINYFSGIRLQGIVRIKYRLK